MFTSTPVLIEQGIRDGGLIAMPRGGTEDRHVSVVIRNLCLKLGHFDQSDPDYVLFELGSAFEDAIARALAERWARAHPDRFVRIGELELDGLLGNPDLYDFVDSAICEMKLTKLSASQDPEGEKFWKYWVQCAAYCKMMDVNLARLHICHINGNYRDNRSPIYHVWERRFTQRELDMNWKMLVSHAA